MIQLGNDGDVTIGSSVCKLVWTAKIRMIYENVAWNVIKLKIKICNLLRGVLGNTREPPIHTQFLTPVVYASAIDFAHLRLLCGESKV